MSPLDRADYIRRLNVANAKDAEEKKSLWTGIQQMIAPLFSKRVKGQ